jgi:LPXTG-motif cell wall-anchored protein
MRNPLLKTLIGLLCLFLLSQLAVLAGPGAALAQPARPTLTPAPPTSTPKPERHPTDTPVPTATELPTATATLAPTEPPAPTATAVPAPVPAQLPTTGGGAADWSVALLLALLLFSTGALILRKYRNT